MQESLSIILPVYNEKENVEKTINDIVRIASRLVRDLEIIAVNDGSTDSTLFLLERMQINLPQLRIVRHDKNMGYGYALRTGIGAAKNEWILLIDADGQYDIGNFGDIWGKKNGYDVVLGYREKRNDSLYRILLGRFGNLLANFILKTNVKDINCGFKLFRAEDTKDLKLCSTGGSISFEIVYRLLKNKKSFAQVPVRHFKRKEGKQTGGRLKVILRIVREAVQVVCGR
ncbi:MAG: glycosyltransferase family 2 protein [Candidatus Omnitrophica bacterium]|nr:glycosyltransferase family 2 protein [Candidatus Omnitrophota bacterium]